MCIEVKTRKNAGRKKCKKKSQCANRRKIAKRNVERERKGEWKREICIQEKRPNSTWKYATCQPRMIIIYTSCTREMNAHGFMWTMCVRVCLFTRAFLLLVFSTITFVHILHTLHVSIYICTSFRRLHDNFFSSLLLLVRVLWSITLFIEIKRYGGLKKLHRQSQRSCLYFAKRTGKLLVLFMLTMRREYVSFAPF